MQIYEYFEQGWLVGNLLNMSLIALSITISLRYAGDRPLMGRLRDRLRGRRVSLGGEDDALRA